jgi:NADP-dependent 3-hydroxy acid dehydrogenase YdfG
VKPTIVVCGHGPGISDAVARRFGRESFAVAIVARNSDRLSVAARALTDAGLDAKAFTCDLGRPDAVRAMIRDVQSALGPIAILHWNAYGGRAGDLTTATIDEARVGLDVAVFGMLAAVQESLADLKAQKGAVLVTGGSLAFYDPKVDAMAVEWGAMGLAVAKAAQHKTAGLLHARLARDGIYVGEVVVQGLVKGTAFDSGNATLEPSAIADRFWGLYERRVDVSVTFG